MVKVEIYVEGGGSGKDLRSRCRKGFSTFIERAGLKGNMPSVKAWGPRNDAYKNFTKAHAKPDVIAVLLVDSEDPVIARTAWQHLRDRDGWIRPARATEDQCHLMVQVMESWFLADPDTLERFYGQGFRKGALPRNPNIEAVSKRDVENGLNQSTANSRKGRYHKGRHSFEILAKIDPEKVMDASDHAANFINALRSM